MARLVEGLSRFFGRVEILARGLENERRAAEIALGRGQPLEAREHARTILAEVPDSPHALALLADAAEDAWLDHEVVTALSELVKWVPWRADVWLRLGRAGIRIEWPEAREALERAAVAPDERESARLALLDLADLDLAGGDAGRAARWLDRIPPSLSGAPDREVALRRAECALARGDLDAAAHAEKGLGEDSPLDGRMALVRARLSAASGGSMVALDLALRAFVLETREADEHLASMVASSTDVLVVDRVRGVVGAAGRLEEPAWAAAFALAEGRRDDARRALLRGAERGNRAAAASLLSLATEARDIEALRAIAARQGALLTAGHAALIEAASLADAGKDAEAQDWLDTTSGDWAAEMRRSIYGRWLPESEPAAWPTLLSELRRIARGTEQGSALGALEALAVERERPLRVAVVGEFNAGKSTFLNALLGEDVAPTGVLPTTATLHWVAWAPDTFARIVVKNAPDRVVPHADLKARLVAIADEGATVERVFIYAPIERLKRVEILDTPGFNAPDPEHIAAARQAFEEAHLAVWLLDATHPLKETERRVLAEVQGLGVPVQILLNKADRLKPPELAAVLEHVRDGLRGVGLTSHAEPIAFSARLSLRGRLGDEEALAASGWADVETLLSEKIVDASEALRERALRRKASRIAGELAATAVARAAEDREAIRVLGERAAALRASAALLRRERAGLALAIDTAVEPQRKLLAADLKPLGELPEDRQRADAGLREYLAERFVARLSEPVIAELGRASAVSPPERAAASVRAVLTGAVASHDAPAHLLERSLDRVLVAAVEAFADALVAEADQPVSQPPSTGLELRAQALCEVFLTRTA